ncbi:MAG TPA: peptidoglycan-binding domain-containing protein [Phycisphaerae bacterium]|nr:peptidoglycan-binding domain-containing protein [Phycisphaerae bacterium]
MTKFITLLIGASLALAGAAQAKQAEQKNKKSKPDQQRQVAPRQPKAPKPQVQAVPRQQVVPKQHPVRTDRGPKGPRKESQQTMKKAWRDAPSTPEGKNRTEVRPNRPVVQPNTLPAVQSNKLKVNKTAKTFRPRHQNFHAKVNSSVASVQFNQNFRIRNAQNWKGNHYNVFRTYRPQWHDRGWWHSNHRHIVLIGGGWYYWNGGYWYPAWGYDNSAAYYPYDGPIYVGDSPRPFDQVVADVQSILQEQGFYRGEVDGLVGPLTQEALAAYQSAQGLEPTAAIDQPTLESLGIT